MFLNKQRLQFFFIVKQSNQLEYFHGLIFSIFSSRLTSILYQNFVAYLFASVAGVPTDRSYNSTEN